MDSYLRLSSFERYVSSLQSCEPVNPINILHVKKRDQYLAQDPYSLQEQQSSKIVEPRNVSQGYDQTSIQKQSMKEIKKKQSKSPKDPTRHISQIQNKSSHKGLQKKIRENSKNKKQLFILKDLPLEFHGILKSPLSERIISPKTESKRVRFRLFSYSSHRQKKIEK